VLLIEPGNFYGRKHRRSLAKISGGGKSTFISFGTAGAS
jgi:hypothetical protein